jgi:hypothetical protein
MHSFSDTLHNSTNQTASNTVHITTEKLHTHIPTSLQYLKTQLEFSSESSFNTAFLKLII